MAPPTRRRLPLPILALLLIGATLVAIAVLAPPWSATPDRLGHEEVGPDPFLSVEVAPTPAELEPLLSSAVTAADDAATQARTTAAATAGTEVEGGAEGESVVTTAAADTAVAVARANAATQPFEDEGIGLIRPDTVAAPAVIPGDPDDVCALADLIAAFADDPGAATALAQVHDIEVADIGRYLGELRAGYLIDDLAVVNHRYRNGTAQPFETVLSAGTAVLVDDAGVPRVRCRCANPLLPAQIELDGLLVDAALFADELVESVIGPDVPAEVEVAGDGLFTNDGRHALGPPDEISVSLGESDDPNAEACRFRVTVAFTDNRLVDGAGDDLRVVERGRSESTFVWIGTSVDDLRPVGEIEGGESSIDIGSVAEPGERFSVVRLCDGPDRASEVPGSDIDAVLALHLDRT